MHQMTIDGCAAHYSGPWGFISQARGAFIRNCQTMRGDHFYNHILPASWSGFYESANP